MITRRKAVIIITGSNRAKVMPILRNHEALVQIYERGQISKVWSKNKTPIVDLNDFLNVCNHYEGNVFVFDTDSLGTSDVTQETVTNEITQFCYSVQIEPGEFKVKNTANNSSNGCMFCEIIGHPGKTTYEHNISSKLVDMIIYESPNFVVIPGLGPLAPGYLMIMSKDHYLSLAQIPDNLYEEYYEIERDIEKILKHMYNKEVGFYEHGTGPNGAVGLKSIVHMHVHVMLDAYLNENYRNMVNMHTISDISQAKEVSYFAYKWTTNGTLWITDDPEVYIQRQFHRQVFAEENNLAKDQFNWRKTAFEEKTETNVWQLFDFLKDIENPRIKARTNSFVESGKKRF